ncbi:MAG: glycosyltransferase family 39 protein [Elusimicrobia bacterium]|nr:glycosyltransferase family 39 protein [Elusimicrobiota bacterium]
MVVGRRDALLALVPVVLCALLLAAADPRGDFPLNDDFQWSDAVFRLVSGGGLRLGEWVYASALTHIFFGSLPALLFGCSDWVLRVWTMAWGSAAAGGAYLLARRFGAGAGAALAGACALAADPLHLTMSASFHLEVTMLAAVLLAVWGLLAFLQSGSLRHLAAASAALGAAALTRQTAAVAVLGMAGTLAARGRLGRREAAALLIPLGLMLAAWRAWFVLDHGPTWGSLALTPAFVPADLLRPAALAAALRRMADAVLTAAFLASPLALAALPAVKRLPRPGRREAAALAAAAALAVDALWRGGMPLMGNTLTRVGLGVVTLNDPGFKEVGWWGSVALWHAASAAALFSTAVLIRLFWARVGDGLGARRARAALAMAAGPVLATALLTHNHDRYLLAWLPLGLLAAVWAPEGRAVPALGLGAALAMGAWSAAGLRDYFAWNRARWEAGALAVSRGAPPAQVENGFDWDGRLTLDRNMKELLSRRRPEEIGPWDWMALNRIVALSSFSPRPPRPDFVPVDSVPYRTPFARGERRIFLYGLKGPGA